MTRSGLVLLGVFTLLGVALALSSPNFDGRDLIGMFLVVLGWVLAMRVDEENG